MKNLTTKEKWLFGCFVVGIVGMITMIVYALISPVCANNKIDRDSKCFVSPTPTTEVVSPSETITDMLSPIASPTAAELPSVTPFSCSEEQYPSCTYNWDRGGFECICKTEDTPTPEPTRVDNTPIPTATVSPTPVRQALQEQPVVVPNTGRGGY